MMQDFDLSMEDMPSDKSEAKNAKTSSGKEMKMTVTQVFKKDGKRYAFVAFSDEKRVAEGRIPECKITSATDFTKQEIMQLENYMRRNTETLWEMANKVNVMDAFMGR